MVKLNKPCVIGFAHPKGGSGKSSTCWNTAAKLQEDDYPISLIDQDPQKQTTKFNSNRSKQFNMIEVKTKEDIARYLSQEIKEVTLIDLGGYDSVMGRAALSLCDIVIIPLCDSDNDIDGMKEFRKTLNKILEKRPEIIVKLLANRVHYNNTSFQRSLSAKAAGNKGYPVFNTTTPYAKEYGTMLYSGKSVTEQTKGSVAIKVNKLYKEIETLIKEVSNG